jgi:hypothetical protein
MREKSYPSSGYPQIIHGPAYGGITLWNGCDAVDTSGRWGDWAAPVPFTCNQASGKSS